VKSHAITIGISEKVLEAIREIGRQIGDRLDALESRIEKLEGESAQAATMFEEAFGRIEKLEGHYHVEFHGTHGETCTEICTTPPKEGKP
jgi:hypothetical protein